MGGVVLHHRKFSRFVELAEVCAEVKRAAKSVSGSTIFVDRRWGGMRRKPSSRNTKLVYPVRPHK
jgi:hypothetical protein